MTEEQMAAVIAMVPFAADLGVKLRSCGADGARVETSEGKLLSQNSQTQMVLS